MNFPKFIGGLQGDTTINQIDVSESTDAIGVAGNTYDKGLTGLISSSYIPIFGVI